MGETRFARCGRDLLIPKAITRIRGRIADTDAMETANPLMIPDLAQALCLVVAFVAGLVAAGAYLRKHRPALAAASNDAVEIIYRETPTVRMVEAQRVDRVRKIARLTPGVYFDVLDTPAGLTPRFRITLRALTRLEKADAVRLFVEFGGTQVSCGPLVKEAGTNEFVIPRAPRDETRGSVFHFHESGQGLDFMRIKVRSIDPAAGSAEVDVLQVASQWPSGNDVSGPETRISGQNSSLSVA
jgi:hypothetical protein